MSIYSDLSKTGNNLKDVKAVVDAVKNICNIRVNELPFGRKKGTYMDDILHEPLTYANAQLLHSEILARVTRWDSRVTIRPESEVLLDIDNRAYSVGLVMEIKDFEETISVDFLLYPKGK